MMRSQLGDALNGFGYRIRLSGRPGSPPLKQVGPMLRGMRKASSNWLGKTIMAVVMGVLIVSFGIWGIADIFKGFGQSTLAIFVVSVFW
jgi:peptidyl-prolyl cis-trans isomerase D